MLYKNSESSAGKFTTYNQEHTVVQLEPRSKQIFAFFFTCMAESCAGRVEASPIPGLPGWKRYLFEKGSLRLVDMYLVSPTGHVAGNTTIFDEERPVFHMTYGGVYPPKAIPLLKEALQTAYAGRMGHCFFRGPRLFRSPQGDLEGYTYFNEVAQGVEGYRHFWGRECIEYAEGSNHRREVGYHTYEGWYWD